MKKLTLILLIISSNCFSQDLEYYTKMAKLGERHSELEGMLYQLEVKLKNKTISNSEISKAFSIVDEMLRIEPELSIFVEEPNMRNDLLARKKAFSSFQSNSSNSIDNNNSNNTTNSNKSQTPIEIEFKYYHLDLDLAILEGLLENKMLDLEQKNKAIEICNELISVPQSLADKLNLDSREYYLEKRNLFQNYAYTNNSNTNYVKPKNENSISLPSSSSKTVECTKVLTFTKSTSSWCNEHETRLAIANNSTTDLWVRIYCPESPELCNSGINKIPAGESRDFYCVSKNFSYACKTQQQWDNNSGWPKFAGYKE